MPAFGGRKLNLSRSLASYMADISRATAFELGYPERLGRLIADLATLEICLRVVLYLLDTPRPNRRSSDWRLADLAVGDEIEDCWLTSWSSLSQLVAAYNERETKAGLEPMDAGIPDLRNALAHGCISTPQPDGLQTLVKFGKATAGKVRVEVKHVMTFEWLAEQTRRTCDATLIVNRRLQELR